MSDLSTNLAEQTGTSSETTMMKRNLNPQSNEETPRKKPQHESRSLELTCGHPPNSATTASDPRGGFCWNRLPGEIRNQIYVYALQATESLLIHCPGQPWLYHPTYTKFSRKEDYIPYRSYRGKIEGQARNPNLSLLRASKQIYQEARLFLFEFNTIKFTSTHDFHCWVHHKLPRSVFVKNSVLWYEYHGKMLTWEISICGDSSGLTLSPILDRDRALRQKEMPNNVVDHFVGSIRQDHTSSVVSRAEFGELVVILNAWMDKGNVRGETAKGKLIKLATDLNGFTNWTSS